MRILLWSTTSPLRSLRSLTASPLTFKSGNGSPTDYVPVTGKNPTGMLNKASNGLSGGLTQIPGGHLGLPFLISQDFDTNLNIYRSILQVVSRFRQE